MELYLTLSDVRSDESRLDGGAGFSHMSCSSMRILTAKGVRGCSFLIPCGCVPVNHQSKYLWGVNDLLTFIVWQEELLPYFSTQGHIDWKEFHVVCAI